METFDIKDLESFIKLTKAYNSWIEADCDCCHCFDGYDFVLNILLLKNKIRKAYLLVLDDSDKKVMPFEIAGIATCYFSHHDQPCLLFYVKGDEDLGEKFLKEYNDSKKKDLVLGQYLGYLTPSAVREESKYSSLVSWRVAVEQVKKNQSEIGTIELYFEYIYDDRELHSLCRERVDQIADSLPSWLPVKGVTYEYSFARIISP